MTDDRTIIDAEEFAQARRDPKVRQLLGRADAYAARMRAEGRLDLTRGEQQLFDLWKAAEQQRDRLRVKAGEARVHLEDGSYGKAHALLEEIRNEEDIEAAEIHDREDDRAAAIESEVGKS